jgi:enamine deaminase RidA (YjgF/YER057c/UK114 family)
VTRGRRARREDALGRNAQQEGVIVGTQEDKLVSLGYGMDKTPKPAGLYTPVVVSGKDFYASGTIPSDGDTIPFKGKVPSAVSVDDAKKAAALCAANILRVFVRDVGPLDRIERLVKITGFVNSEADFTEQHVVMNGASQLFIDVLGEAGRHARSAVGMAGLPLGVAVEVEVIGRLRS